MSDRSSANHGTACHETRDSGLRLHIGKLAPRLPMGKVSKGAVVPALVAVAATGVLGGVAFGLFSGNPSSQFGETFASCECLLKQV